MQILLTRPSIISLVFFIYTNAQTPLNCIRVKQPGENCIGDNECSLGWCYNNKCNHLTEKFEKNCGPEFKCPTGFGCITWGNANLCAPIAQKGEACQMTSTGPHLCGEGLFCYDGICDFVKGANSKCSDDGKCGENDFCITFQNTCQKKRSKLGLCKHTRECKAGLYCHPFFNFCVSDKLANRRCSGGDCGEQLDCLPNKDISSMYLKPYKCQKIPSEGEFCVEKCATGYYCGKLT
jgi:hypothetical protein